MNGDALSDIGFLTMIGTLTSYGFLLLVGTLRPLGFLKLDGTLIQLGFLVEGGMLGSLVVLHHVAHFFMVDCFSSLARFEIVGL